MWNRIFAFRSRRVAILATLLVTALVATVLLWPAGSLPDDGERTRAQLDLRDGVLFLPSDNRPFNGTLVENYDKDARKLAITIRNGKADGISRGWFDSGQLEVEESFVEGTANGLRTRWFPNGVKKSEATIVDGKITGRFVQWHDNGQIAASVNMADGQPHGLAEAWHPSGNPKSRVQLDHGTPVDREFFPDTNPLAQADNPSPAQ